MLGPDLEPIARALNGRVRRQFEMVRSVDPARRGGAAGGTGWTPRSRRCPGGKDAIPDGLEDTWRASPAGPPVIPGPTGSW